MVRIRAHCAPDSQRRSAVARGSTMALAQNMFEGFKRERRIRKVLRALARQRVAVILQPQGVWVVEHAPTGMPYLDEAIRTCLLRGWVAVLEEAVPQGALNKGQLPQGPLFNGQGAVYRLTEAGWFVINRSHTWVLATFFMALLSVLASVVALWRQ